MKKKALHFTRRSLPAPAASETTAANPPSVRNSLSTTDIARCLHAWVAEGIYRQQSPLTNNMRSSVVGKLLWFLENNGHAICGDAELRDFFVYLTTGHEEKGGRWGKADTRPGMSERLRKAPRPATTATYHAYLRAFFTFLVEQGILDATPMARIKAPEASKDQPDPFTPAQIDSLLLAAAKTTQPERDTLIVWLLLDTGLRASELCSIRLADVDMLEKKIRVTGKGDKARTVYFGRTTSQAFWKYLRQTLRDPTSLAREAPAAARDLSEGALFIPQRGRNAGGEDGLTSRGLYQLMSRLTASAGIDRPRRGPHTFRNTFAVSMLADGSSEKATQELLGHATLAMTHHYAKLAGAHIGAEHRLHSPADKHRKRGK